MRTARITLLYAAVLALPYLVVGLFSDGEYASRLIGGGVVLLVVSGVASAWMAWRGRKIDEAQDERQVFIAGNASRFSFVVMAVAVQVYWALQFAAEGNEGDSSFWLLVTLWSSFLGGYVYNSVRH
jgi:F0F1-type ATP synthase assembly protein I